MEKSWFQILTQLLIRGAGHLVIRSLKSPHQKSGPWSSCCGRVKREKARERPGELRSPGAIYLSNILTLVVSLLLLLSLSLVLPRLRGYSRWLGRGKARAASFPSAPQSLCFPGWALRALNADLRPPHRDPWQSPGRRPSATRADSVSVRAPCWQPGAGAASGLYIKAAWRARPGRVRSAQGERCAA